MSFDRDIKLLVYQDLRITQILLKEYGKDPGVWSSGPRSCMDSTAAARGATRSFQFDLVKALNLSHLQLLLSSFYKRVLVLIFSAVFVFCTSNSAARTI